MKKHFYFFVSILLCVTLFLSGCDFQQKNPSDNNPETPNIEKPDDTENQKPNNNTENTENTEKPDDKNDENKPEKSENDEDESKTDLPDTNPADTDSTDSSDSTDSTSSTDETTDSSDNTQDTTDEAVYVTKIDAGKAVSADGHGWLITGIQLYDFANKTVDVDFSVKMKVANTGDTTNLAWTLNINGYPTVASNKFEKGVSEWITVSGKKTGIKLEDYTQLYISTYQITPENLTIYLKDISLKVTNDNSEKIYTELSDKTGASIIEETEIPTVLPETDDTESSTDEGWLADSVPSLYETYKDLFDSIGIAAEFGNFGLQCSGDKYTGTYTQVNWGTPSELYYDEVQNGIKKHANSITLGNELKPQFLLQWWDGNGSNQTMVDFTGSNGTTIKVPDKLNGESLIYATLNVTKKMGVKMRGHVLTWHSQTPDGFFAEGYKPEYDGNLLSNPVDKATMTARHEWYIKTVLECVDAWEKANNYRAIWAWDVVNEAMADDAGKSYTGDSQNWLRGSTSGTKNMKPENGGSRWFQIYENEEFIINAFRFANAYAPADVKLCYNDYNEYMDYSAGWKTSAIEHIAQLIKDGNAETINGKSISPRLDVIAMQSHVGTSWPGVSGYESALKRFLEIADVHVSELDFSAETEELAKTAYKDYFTLLQKYGKNYSGAHQIKNVTIWGINNESSWINPSHAGGKKTYPLLFNLINNVDTNKKKVTYDTGAETLPQYDIGDSYKPNNSFWAVINAHN